MYMLKCDHKFHQTQNTKQEIQIQIQIQLSCQKLHVARTVKIVCNNSGWMAGQKDKI